MENDASHMKLGRWMGFGKVVKMYVDHGTEKRVIGDLDRALR
jgi:hypothetical protein